ncbi:hypothetical protein WR25_23950 isoform D [Diploscapter pachys]|uniref:SXP/RAL-2 family protein Ani s 5-like cation-binding domain-containing protein n=1 Tax=Diploscapter pachys TaxID=2018661 RepID=A0A2A2LAG2_9BILA|nr:hypothetical protein WR25_23950 isoform D [Diploscapter pachys]
MFYINLIIVLSYLPLSTSQSTDNAASSSGQDSSSYFARARNGRLQQLNSELFASHVTYEPYSIPTAPNPNRVLRDQPAPIYINQAMANSPILAEGVSQSNQNQEQIIQTSDFFPDPNFIAQQRQINPNFGHNLVNSNQNNGQNPGNSGSSGANSGSNYNNGNNSSSWSSNSGAFTGSSSNQKAILISRALGADYKYGSQNPGSGNGNGNGNGNQPQPGQGKNVVVAPGNGWQPFPGSNSGGQEQQTFGNQNGFSPNPGASAGSSNNGNGAQPQPGQNVVVSSGGRNNNNGWQPFPNSNSGSPQSQSGNFGQEQQTFGNQNGFLPNPATSPGNSNNGNGAQPQPGQNVVVSNGGRTNNNGWQPFPNSNSGNSQSQSGNFGLQQQNNGQFGGNPAPSGNQQSNGFGSGQNIVNVPNPQGQGNSGGGFSASNGQQTQTTGFDNTNNGVQLQGTTSQSNNGFPDQSTQQQPLTQVDQSFVNQVRDLWNQYFGSNAQESGSSTPAQSTASPSSVLNNEPHKFLPNPAALENNMVIPSSTNQNSASTQDNSAQRDFVYVYPDARSLQDPRFSLNLLSDPSRLPHFLQEANPDQVSAYLAITTNTDLTKSERNRQLNEWLQRQDPDVQTSFLAANSAQQRILDEMDAAQQQAESKLSLEAKQVAQQIRAIRSNQNMTVADENRLITEILQEVPTNIRKELQGFVNH